MATKANAGQAAGSSADASAEAQAGGTSQETGTVEAATDDATRQKMVDIGYRKGLQAAEKQLAAERERVRRSTLEELGLTSDEALAEHKARLAEADKSRPEWERKAIEHERKAKEYAAKLDEAHKKIQLATEWAVTERRGRVASEVAQIANLKPEAAEDLDLLLGAKLAQAEDGKLVYRHGDVEVDLMTDGEASKKLAQHIAALRPHWVRPSMTPGAGSAPSRPQNGARALTAEEQKQEWARSTVSRLGLGRPS